MATADDQVLGVGSVVLAAGSSRRPGSCPQLLELQGEPLVRRAARAAVDAGLWPVVVVVGDRAEEVRAALAGLPVVTVANAAFDQGLSGSIRLGLLRLTECAPSARGVVVLPCDQPAVGAVHLRALAGASGADRVVAASSYAGSVGMPALFPTALFQELRSLTGDGGCAELLARHAARVATVPLPDGELDVHSPEGWNRAQHLQPG